MSIKTVIRLIGTVLAVIVAVAVSLDRDPRHQMAGLEVGIIVGCALVAFIISPYITLIPYRWIREKIRHAAVSDLIAGAIGLIIGLCIAALAGALISPIRFFEIGQWLPILVAFALAYICTAAAVWRKDDFARLFGSMIAAIGAGRRSAPREEPETEESEEHEELPRLRSRFGKKGNSAPGGFHGINSASGAAHRRPSQPDGTCDHGLGRASNAARSQYGCGVSKRGELHFQCACCRCRA